jgi:hypothetical protein
MKHYIVYHSVEKMGTTFRGPESGNSGEFCIVTRKKVDRLPGNIVWLISGEGKPRDYRLEHWFIVAGTERIDDDEFLSEAIGTEGVRLGGIPLNGLPWFKAFSDSQNHFSLGLQPIKDEFVANLAELARSKGFRVPAEIPEASPTSAQTKMPIPSADPVQPPDRVSVICERIIRDSAITKTVKQLHDFRCQVCGDRLEVRTEPYVQGDPLRPYAEGAHIRPLGSPHDGQDVLDNVLCLCPNHHVLLDGGAFSIADNFSLIGAGGRLRVAKGHDINREHLQHHRRRFRFEET